MDHDAVTRSCNIWIGCWTRPGIIANDIKEENVRVTMGLEVSKRHIFEAYIIHGHGPTCFVVGEAKEVL